MKKMVIGALKSAGISERDIEKFIEKPKNPERGDFALPCFFLVKKLKKTPKQAALEISLKIKDKRNFEKIEAVGPYLNFFINRSEFAKYVLNKISKEKENYGATKKSLGDIILEFSQPNTHKAFHVGHIRGTSLGESLARIFEFNKDKVIRANYSGDTGMHIAKWIWCYINYHSKEAIINEESWFAKIYVDAMSRLEKNPLLQEEVDEINKKLDSKKDKKLNELWRKTRNISVKSWRKIYDELGVKFDVHYFESEVEQESKLIVNNLVKRKIAEVSDGATIMNLKERGLGVWVLLRKDGTVLYSAKDIALAERKFKNYKVKRSLVITDSAQDLHFKQLIKTLELMNFDNYQNYKHLSYGAIRFPWGKMSSRTGENILYSEFKESVIKQSSSEIKKRFKLSKEEIYERALKISISAIKYWMLKQDTNKTIIFNPKEAISFEGNTGPYLLYSYARAASILKRADQKKPTKLVIKKINEKEKRLISELENFPEIVEDAYFSLSPNLIANYAYELSKTFNEFYHDNKVVGSDEENLRLKLVWSFMQVLKISLYLLGIETIEKM